MSIARCTLSFVCDRMLTISVPLGEVLVASSSIVSFLPKVVLEVCWIVVSRCLSLISCLFCPIHARGLTLAWSAFTPPAASLSQYHPVLCAEPSDTFYMMYANGDRGEGCEHNARQADVYIHCQGCPAYRESLEHTSSVFGSHAQIPQESTMLRMSCVS